MACNIQEKYILLDSVMPLSDFIALARQLHECSAQQNRPIKFTAPS